MIVRDARPSESAALNAVYRASVEGLGPRAYAAEQVAVWAGATPDAASLTARLSDGRVRLVVEDEGRLAGFADLERNGHVDLFYAAPHAAGTRAAPMLYDALQARAIMMECPKLFGEISAVARPFFERRDFIVTARRDFQIGNVAIHNYAMEKRLER